MKSLKTNLITGILCLFAISVSLISCNDDDASSTGPVVENVSLAQNDSLVEFGYADNMYIIRGKGFSNTQKIYFNNVDTYFNSTLVTDNVIIVTIDRNTPYENTTNELRIATTNGSVTYPFVVAPPAPAIKSFNPINPAAGDVITITGSYFLDPQVDFGGIAGEVISSTLTQIKVKVPEGANHKYVRVTTISGKGRSWEAVGTALFDDVWYNGWYPEANVTSTTSTDTRQGGVYLKSENGGWSGNQFRDINWGTIDITPYKGIRFSIKGEAAGKIALIINGKWADAESIPVTITTEWQDIEIPFSQFPFEVTGFQSLVIKEFTGSAAVYHVDDIGLVLKD